MNIWSITKGKRFQYVIATLCSTISHVCLMGIPVISMYGLDVLIERDFDYANVYLLNLSNAFSGTPSFSSYLLISAVAGVVITVTASIFQFCRNRLSATVSESIARKLREVLFDRLHRTTASFYDKEETGDLVQRCTSDVDTIRRFMHSDVDDLGRALLFLAVMLPVLFWRNVALAWLSLALLPVITVGGIYFFSRISTLFRLTDEAEGSLTAVLQENLTGIRVVQAFARESFEFDRFSARNREFRDRYVTLNTYEAVYWGLSDLLCLTQMGIVLFFGGYFVIHEQLSIGELFMFTSLTGVVIWRIRQLIHVVEHAGKTRVSLSRVNHILASEQELDQSSPQVAINEGEIVFENVSLHYGDRNQALNGVNLSIASGETIGIVGPPGSGKSTLVRALLRFYPLSEGRITIDGIDVASMDVTWLRSQIACVMQEPFLYSKSVKANLEVGRMDAPMSEITASTQMAEIHSSIASFPKKYESLVGERGVTLSGGQRQRIALARALLSDSPILILDDVLSAVDTRTEAQILNNLTAATKAATTIIIAHRLTTIRNADRIVVMNAGKIVEVGTHEHLVRQSGLYRELWDIQDLLDESIQYETELAANE